MSHKALREFVNAKAADLGVVGGAVGMLIDDAEVYACTGVTSADNPVPVNGDTLFALGSVTKTSLNERQLIAKVARKRTGH